MPPSTSSPSSVAISLVVKMTKDLGEKKAAICFPQTMAYKGHVHKCSKEHEISCGPSWREEGEQMASGKIASELTRVSTD